MSIVGSDLWMRGDATNAGGSDWTTVVSHLPVAITVESRAGDVIYANPLANELLGVPGTAEITGAAADELWTRAQVRAEDGALIPAARRPARRMVSGESGGDVTVRLRAAGNGSERWLSLRTSPLHDAVGAIGGAITLWHDVTTLKRSEGTQRLLAEAGAALSATLDIEATLATVARMAVPALADWCVVFLVEDQSIRRVELAAADPAREALLQQIQERFPPVWDSPLPAARAIRSGEPVISQVVDDAWLAEYTRDDAYRDLAAAIGLRSVLAVPLIANGRTLGALSFGAAQVGHFGPETVAVATELARRAAQAVDNARLYAEAREAIDARDRFLSIAAHELRTPVAVMKAFAELLEREQRRGTLTPERTTHLIGRIVSGAVRLDHLTSEVLDVARSHLGRLPLRPREFDLHLLVSEIVDRHQERAAETHRVVVEGGETFPIVADPDRIEQVVVNLIENALKYSPTGGTIRVAIMPEESGVRVSVQDEGIGLPQTAIETIFTPFERAPNASERGIPGLGLGLYIGRSFVERHGGRIWAESAGEDQGTSVSFWLPAHPIEQPAPS